MLFSPDEFDPLDLIKLCRRLQNSGEEANIRTILSRAYYAAYLYAERFLPETEIEKEMKNVNSRHLAVNRVLNRRSKASGTYLAKLWVRRSAADYTMKTPTRKYSDVLGDKIPVDCSETEAGESISFSSLVISDIQSRSRN